MEQQQYNKLFTFLWNIANDVLVQAFEKGDYKKITLPFIVLRRLDLLLADTKQQVLDFSKTDTFRELPEESQESQLCMLTRHPLLQCLTVYHEYVAWRDRRDASAAQLQGLP